MTTSPLKKIKSWPREPCFRRQCPEIGRRLLVSRPSGATSGSPTPSGEKREICGRTRFLVKVGQGVVRPSDLKTCLNFRMHSGLYSKIPILSKVFDLVSRDDHTLSLFLDNVHALGILSQHKYDIVLVYSSLFLDCGRVRHDCHALFLDSRVFSESVHNFHARLFDSSGEFAITDKSM